MEDIVFNAKLEGASSLKQLKDLYKEVQIEQGRTVKGTAEYQAALEKLGKVKDEIGDLKDTINALNPEGKIAAFTNLAGKIAGGFQAATGAAALFGSESEELEKTLLKVQAATAFAEGIQSITAMGDAFQVLKTVLLSNPIFLVAAAVAAAAAAIKLFNDYLDRIAEEAAKKSIQRLQVISGEVEKRYSREATLAAASGKQTAAIEIQKTRLLEENVKIQIVILERLKLKKGELNEEEVKSYKELQDRLLNLTTERISKQLELQITFRDQVKQADKDAASSLAKEGLTQLEKELYEIEQKTKQKLEEFRKASSPVVDSEEEAKASNRAELEIKEQGQREKNEVIKKYAKDLNEFIKSSALEGIKIDSDQTIEQAREQYKRIKNSKDALTKKAADEYEYNDKSLQADYKNSQDEVDLTKDKIDKIRSLEDEERAYEMDAQDRRMKEDIENYRRAKEEKIKLAAEEASAKEQILNTSLQAAQGLSDLYFQIQLNNVKKGSAAELEIRKKQFQVNKAFGIVNAVIDGIGAVQKALNNPYPLNLILAAASGVLAAVNVAKIAATKFDAGTGGGPASLPSTNTSVPNIPSASDQPTTRFNADGTVQTGANGPTRAYVLESDITDSQRRINRIEKQSKF